MQLVIDVDRLQMELYAIQLGLNCSQYIAKWLNKDLDKLQTYSCRSMNQSDIQMDLNNSLLSSTAFR